LSNDQPSLIPIEREFASSFFDVLGGYDLALCAAKIG